MTKEEILNQIQFTIVDAVENCNDAYVSHGTAHDEAIDAYNQVAEYIDELLTRQLSAISRVEVITEKGRVYSKWVRDNHAFKISLQDDNRTIKIFEVLEY